MSKYRLSSLPVMVILSLALVTGCGGGGGDDSQEAPPEPAAWSKTFALGQGRSVAETPTGYAVAGTTTGAAATRGSDAYFFVTDGKGQLVGGKPMGDIGNDTGRAVRWTHEGGYVMFGEFMLGGNRQLWVVKMDGKGNDQWDRFYGYATLWEDAADILEITHSGYLLAGTTNANVFLVRTNLDGDVLWADQKGYDSSSESAAALQATSDGSYVVVGKTTQFDRDGDIWLVKVAAADGKTLWHRHFGTTGVNDEAASVRETADQGFIICGTTGSVTNRQIYLLKTDAEGNLQWSRALGGGGSERCAALELTRDGGFILAGSTTSSGAGAADGYLVKTDAQGQVLWATTFGATGDDHFHAVQGTRDGGYVMAGSTEREGETYIYLVKTDANGSALP